MHLHHVKMQHRIQKSDEKHLMNNLKLPQCVQISQVIMAKHENCVCRTMNLPHYTDCNMATDMLWSDKNSCHMGSIFMASDTIDLQISCHVMRPNYHIILSTIWQQIRCVHILFATRIYYPCGNRDS